MFFCRGMYQTQKECRMNEQRRLIVVDSSVLPEVILKVLAVKKLLASREEKSSASACKRIGISRSAYYKYRDSVFSYDDKMTKRILTLSAFLRDEPGILSSVLVTLHACEANILTVNQNIPMDGVAAVTISLRLSGGNEGALQLRTRIAQLKGVVDVKLLSGE